MQSDYSSDEETKERGLIIPEETIWERITALKDIVSPSTRRSIASKISTFTSYSSTALLFGGRAAWVLTTTSLLIGLPYALAVEDEMRISQQERDLASQQQGAQQVRTLHFFFRCVLTFPLDAGREASRTRYACSRSTGRLLASRDPASWLLIRGLILVYHYKSLCKHHFKFSVMAADDFARDTSV